MPVLRPELIEKIKKKHEGVIKIQSSDDGIVLFPEYIAKMSGTIKNIITDLGGNIPDQPLANPYSVTAIQDIRNIIGQRFHFPIKEAIAQKKYSLAELIERFNFLHFLEFPINIQNFFKDEIMNKIKLVNPDDLVKNKKAINTLDPDLEEFKPLLTLINTSITIVDEQGRMAVFPENIWRKSQYFNTMLGDLGGTIPEEAIPFTEYPIYILRDIPHLISIINERPEGLNDALKTYSLDTLIQIANCLDRFAFPKEIQKPIESRMYLLCKQTPEQLSDPNISHLNPNIVERTIGNIVVDKLQCQLLKTSLHQADRQTPLRKGRQIAFSSNNKMLAVGGFNKSVTVWTFNSDGTLNNSPQELQTNDWISTVAFSPDNKKLAIGIQANENNILLYNIDVTGKIDKAPQILLGHQSTTKFYVNSIANIAFSPSSKQMLSVNTNYNNNLLLWTFDENGMITQQPQVLASNLWIISPIHFSDDGKILIVSEEPDKSLYLWTFDENGVGSSSNIKGNFRTDALVHYPIVFYSHDKKFVIQTHDGNDRDLYICNFNNNNNITVKQILHQDRHIWPIDIVLNDTILIVENYDPFKLVFFDISDDENITHSTIPVPSGSNFWNLHYSPDGKKVVLAGKDTKSILCTTMTNQEEKLLNNVKKLDIHQLLALDKVLDDAQDTPLTQYTIPENVMPLLQKLNLISAPLPPKNPLLEKAIDDTRRYFISPHLQTVEQRTQAIQTLKNIYQGIQKKALEIVVKEMGLSHLLK